MNFAYADPPYVGQAKKHYSTDPEHGEVDHKILIEMLSDCFDCWALSLSTPSLQQILALCPSDVRIGSWVKPFAIFKPNVNPGYTWEPVIFRGGRKLTRKEPTVRDWAEDPDCVRQNITLKKGLVGVKPEAFCFWMFRFVGAIPEDIFTDLFPGSGAVADAWDKYCLQFKAVA